MPGCPGVVPATRYLLGPAVSRSARHVVYRGTDVVLGRRVAVKVAGPAAADPRLAREEQCLARVRHRGVPQLWDREPLPDGRSALVLEWVGPRGPAVCDRPPVGPAALVADLSGALLAVHAAGWTHGAVVPEHVLTDPDGRSVLVGFGGAQPPGPARAAAVERDLDDLRVTLLTLLLDPVALARPPGSPPAPGWSGLLVAAGRLTGAGGRPALLSLHAAAAAVGRAPAW